MTIAIFEKQILSLDVKTKTKRKYITNANVIALCKHEGSFTTVEKLANEDLITKE